MTDDERQAVKAWPLTARPEAMGPLDLYLREQALHASPAFLHFRRLWSLGVVDNDGYLTPAGEAIRQQP